MKPFMFTSALALSLCIAAQGANYYVDATALRPGSGQASKGGDGSAKAPFATIQAAADVAQAGDTVFIKPGTYTETVKPKNSGKEGSPITFRNCPGEEKPTICAGDRVTGPWKDEGGGIYSAACPWNVGSARNHDAASLTNNLAFAGNVVVVDGDMMIEAREPNISGKEQIAEVRRLGRLFGCENPKDGTLVKGVPAWPAEFWKGGVLWMNGGWAACSASITNSQPAGADCRMLLGARTSEWGWPEYPGACFLTGARGALNAEKEFYLDEAAGRLYLMAPGAVDPSGMAVYAKKRFTAIDMSGRGHVVFDRINTMMGGIVMRGATNCVLRNGRHRYSCHFYRFQGRSGGSNLLGGYPNIASDDYARGVHEAAAVYVSGDGNTIEGCEIAYAAAGVQLDGWNHVVRNCTITDIYGGTYFSAIYISPFDPVEGGFPNYSKADVSCGGHVIERNTIARVCRSFINIADKTGGQGGTTYKKSLIRYNHLSDFMELTEDGGGIYAWWIDAGGTEVAYNWIHGEHGGYAFNPALYADDGTLGFRYHHNVVWDVKLGIGWNRVRGGHEAYNNTLWGRTGSLTLTLPSTHSGCKVYNNLSNKPFKDTSNSEVKNNLTSGGFVGNPDKPTSGLDFRLAKGSPAIDAGVVITGITDRAVGAPDVGAYEFGGVEWIPGAGTEPVPPAAPIDFSATAMSGHGIRLGWSDNAFNETAYRLERSTDGKAWAALATLPANAFSYMDAGFHLKAGTAYQYRVAATNAFGRSASVNARATTPAAVKAPAITSPLAAKGWQSVAFSYTITAANDPAKVTAEGLPKGLAFNPVTGVISGYPEGAGEGKIKITATNAKGSDAKTLTLTIAKPAPLAVKGGTVTEYADADGVRWTVLTFTNNGSFSVSGGPAEYLIVAGGGGGGGSGGGGAGGFLTGPVKTIGGDHRVVVGAGGGAMTNGEPSSIIGPMIYWTATGGGRGGNWHENGQDGGSGGGAGKNSAKGGNALPPVTVATRQDATLKHGHKGGDSNGDTYRGAGGGGAGGVGGNGSSDNNPGPPGGPGISSAIQDGKTTKWYAAGGGGGGSGLGNPGGPGGSGIGGNGSGKGVPATDGKLCTGSGGGAGGGKGGSGIVIVRFVGAGK